jgi:hypothetical protein
MKIGIYSFAETPFDPTTGGQLDVGGRLGTFWKRSSLPTRWGWMS